MDRFKTDIQNVLCSPLEGSRGGAGLGKRSRRSVPLVLVSALFAILLFPGLASIVVGFYLEPIARAVEARHYPNLAEPRDQPLRETIMATIKLAAMTVVLNLVFLPVYAVLSFVPPLNIFVFYGLNGYLLGREYF